MSLSCYTIADATQIVGNMEVIFPQSRALKKESLKSSPWNNFPLLGTVNYLSFCLTLPQPRFLTFMLQTLIRLSYYLFLLSPLNQFYLHSTGGKTGHPNEHGWRCCWQHVLWLQWNNDESDQQILWKRECWNICGCRRKKAQRCANRNLEYKDKVDEALTKDHLQAICVYTSKLCSLAMLTK